MQIGLGILGWSPNQFWAATINELNAAAAGVNRKNGGSDPASRPDLDEMMEQYPDGDSQR